MYWKKENMNKEILRKDPDLNGLVTHVCKNT